MSDSNVPAPVPPKPEAPAGIAGKNRFVLRTRAAPEAAKTAGMLYHRFNRSASVRCCLVWRRARHLVTFACARTCRMKQGHSRRSVQSSSRMLVRGCAPLFAVPPVLSLPCAHPPLQPFKSSGIKRKKMKFNVITATRRLLHRQLPVNSTADASSGLVCERSRRATPFERLYTNMLQGSRTKKCHRTRQRNAGNGKQGERAVAKQANCQLQQQGTSGVRITPRRLARLQEQPRHYHHSLPARCGGQEHGQQQGQQQRITRRSRNASQPGAHTAYPPKPSTDSDGEET